MSKPNYAALAGALLIVGAGVFSLVGYLFHRPPAEEVPAVPATAPSRQAAAPVAAPAPPPSVAPSMAPSPVRRDADGAAWAAFRDRFGQDLKADLTPGGRLVAVSGRGTPAPGADFRPDDPQRAIARAKEVIDAARELLGLQPELPIEDPIARASQASAQVYFHEKSGGVPIAPQGGVSVDLGPQGEVLGVRSNYVPDVQVANQALIDRDAAKAKALAAAPDPTGNPRAEGGRHVIWVTPAGQDAPATGRHAYEYSVQGHQTIVDGSSGEILFQRDRRQF